MATVTLTKDSFEEAVTGNDIVLVDFWASWCGPCRTFAPVFEQSSDRHPEITFGKIDTEDQQDLAGAFGIMSIPTLMIFREGIAVFSQPGALPETALESLIEQVQALDMDEVRKVVHDHDHAHDHHDHAHDHHDHAHDHHDHAHDHHDHAHEH